MRLENRKSPPYLASGLRPVVCPPASSLGHRERSETNNSLLQCCGPASWKSSASWTALTAVIVLSAPLFCGKTERSAERQEPSAAAPGLASPRFLPRQSSFILSPLTLSLLSPSGRKCVRLWPQFSQLTGWLGDALRTKFCELGLHFTFKCH